MNSISNMIRMQKLSIHPLSVYGNSTNLSNFRWFLYFKLKLTWVNVHDAINNEFDLDLPIRARTQ